VLKYDSKPNGDKKCEEWELYKDVVRHRFLSDYTANTLTRKLLKGLEVKE
jgi:hypothetical protein